MHAVPLLVLNVGQVRSAFHCMIREPHKADELEYVYLRHGSNPGCEWKVQRYASAEQRASLQARVLVATLARTLARRDPAEPAPLVSDRMLSRRPGSSNGCVPATNRVVPCRAARWSGTRTRRMFSGDRPSYTKVFVIKFRVRETTLRSCVWPSNPSPIY